MSTFPNDRYDLEFVYNEREAWEDDIRPYMEDVHEAPGIYVRLRPVPALDMRELQRIAAEIRKTIPVEMLGTVEIEEAA